MSWHPRHTVLTVICGTWLLCYMDRMVTATAVPFIARDFHLSPVAVGGILSAFFVGYALLQIPGGALADRYGPRAVLTCSIGWWSLMTALTGMAQGLRSLLAIRVLFGLGEGPFPSAAAKALSVWFPPGERGRAMGLSQASTYAGAAIAPLFAVSVIAAAGWRWVFYVLLLPGIFITGAVAAFVRNHAHDSRREGMPIEGPRSGSENVQPIRTNWRACARNPAVLWCAASLFLANVVAWGLMNWMPTYLLQGWGFRPQKMAAFTAGTNLAGAAGFVVGGYVCDRLFRTRMRIPAVLGLVASAAFTWLAAIATNGEWAVAALVCAFFVSNISFTALFTLPLVIVPEHSVGGTFGIVNTAAQVSGVLAPLLVGYVLDLSGSDFHAMLYFMVVLTVAAIYPAVRIQQPPPGVIPFERPA